MGWRARMVAAGLGLAVLGSGSLTCAEPVEFTRTGVTGTGKAARQRDLALLAQDLDRVRRLGLDVYRFSIEWSRVEPAPGLFDVSEIDYYRQVADLVKRRGLRPVAGLHHSAPPGWLDREGEASGRAWTSSSPAVTCFRDYAERMAVELGDRIDHWTILDEPARLQHGVQDLVLVHRAAYLALKAADTWDADGDGFPAVVGLDHDVLSPLLDAGMPD